jgi:hypothetical protein
LVSVDREGNFIHPTRNKDCENTTPPQIKQIRVIKGEWIDECCGLFGCCLIALLVFLVGSLVDWFVIRVMMIEWWCFHTEARRDVS